MGGIKNPQAKNLDPVVYACLRYAIDHELAYKSVDYFIRRTGALFFDINWVQTHKDTVIQFMRKEFNWTEEQDEAYRGELDQIIYETTHLIDTEISS